MSSERPYLSIGEVLELLKDEFPDLSISRIRGFESGGHLELERTASGYRKFYDQDIVFLRSLIGGNAAVPPPDSIERPEKSLLDSSELTDHEGDYHDSGPLELGPNGELPGEPERRHPAAFQSLRRELASQSGVAQREVPGVGRVATVEPALSLVGPVTPSVPLAVEEPGALSATDLPVPDLPATDLPATDRPATDRPATDRPATDLPATSRSLFAANPSGLSLSLHELLASAGVTLETVRELEGLGLVKGQGVFSTVYYDEDALMTCKLVASFLTFGVEPRHLRMYKLAADREASFFEQVVTPQLRRRNPDARATAIETLSELVRLGEQLRVVALRQVLKAAVDR